MRSYIDSKVIC